MALVAASGSWPNACHALALGRCYGNKTAPFFDAAVADKTLSAQN